MATSKWSEIQSFGNETFITHKVGNHEVKFWPVSVGLLLQLRGLVQPLSQAISTLTAGTDKDTGHTYREVGKPMVDDEGNVITIGGRAIRDTESITQALDPRTAKYREDQRAKAIERIMEAVGDDKNREAIGAIIIDSVKRGDFFGSVPTPAEFMDKLTPDMLVQFVTGVAKANKGVFGPLAGRFGDLTKAVAGRVNLGPKGTTTQTESGETSPIRSCGSSNEDTDPSGSSDSTS